MRNFKELKIWQQGMEIVKETYSVASQLADSNLDSLLTKINEEQKLLNCVISAIKLRSGQKPRPKF